MTSRLHCACDTHRRGFLTGLMGLGAGALLPGCATPAAAAPPRIDTHHHFFSPTYVAELDKVGQAPAIVKNWSLARTLDDMARAADLLQLFQDALRSLPADATVQAVVSAQATTARMAMWFMMISSFMGAELTALHAAGCRAGCGRGLPIVKR